MVGAEKPRTVQHDHETVLFRGDPSQFQLGVQLLRTPASKRNHHEKQVLGKFQALKKLWHPHICKYTDCLTGHWQILVVSEHYSRSLRCVLSTRQMEFLPVSTAFQTTFECLSAISFLQSNGIVHGRVSPDTILLDCDGRVKLSECGVQFLVKPGSNCVLANAPYVAPELTRNLCSSPLGGKSDVWSVGIVLLEMLQGPFDAANVKRTDSKSELLTDSKEEDGFETQHQRVGGLRVVDAAVMFMVYKTSDEVEVDACAFGSEDDLTVCSEDDRTQLKDDLVSLGHDSIEAATLFQLEKAFRMWLRGDALSEETRKVAGPLLKCMLGWRDRHSVRSLLSHPAFGEDIDCSLPERLKWAQAPILQCEKMKSSARSQDHWSHFVFLGDRRVHLDEVYYWWQLAGGDCFAHLTQELVLAPIPPLFRLPTYERRIQPNEKSGKGSLRGGSARSRSNSPPQKLPAFAKFGSGKAAAPSGPPPAYQISFGMLPNDRGKAGLWTGHDLVLPVLGLPLDPLLDTIKEQEAFPDTPGTRPNLHSFPFQWWSVSRLRPLLSVLPSSRQQVLLHCKQYGVPPVLRRQVWTALLGVEASAEVDPTEDYHRLLSQPCQIDMQGSYSDAQSLRDPLLTSPEGRRRLHDVVHAALNANPSFVHAQRMQVLAGPVVALFFAVTSQ